MLKDKLIKSCKILRLSRNLVENSVHVEADNFQEYLLKLLNLEIEHRKEAKRERLIKTAGVYARKTFDDYRFDEVRLPSGVTPEYLKRVSFMDEVENLILYGNVGTGKPHLAIAMGMEAYMRELKVGFYRTANLVNRLSDVKKTGGLTKVLASIKKLDLLICDEWGYVPFDREAVQLLFQVISDSYERRSVIITTNLEFSRWVGIFYDEQMTAAIIDRLIHHSYLLLFDGPSNRVRNSLMKLESLKSSLRGADKILQKTRSSTTVKDSTLRWNAEHRRRFTLKTGVLYQSDFNKPWNQNGLDNGVYLGELLR